MPFSELIAHLQPGEKKKVPAPNAMHVTGWYFEVSIPFHLWRTKNSHFFFSSVCDFWSLIFLAIMWSREKKVISLISSQRARGAHTAHNNFSIGITDNYSATCSPSVHTCSIVVVSDIQSTKFRTEYRFYCFSVVSPIFFFISNFRAYLAFIFIVVVGVTYCNVSISVYLSLSFFLFPCKC